MADDKKKDGEANWGERLVCFGIGVGVGVTGTVIAGHLSDGKVPVPEPLKNALAPQGDKPKG